TIPSPASTIHTDRCSIARSCRCCSGAVSTRLTTSLARARSRPGVVVSAIATSSRSTFAASAGSAPMSVRSA
ncbi:hypothetical protein, partial [Agrococcus sp. DT81.2]|uniref:hypothetical protein n=1 Tax=Agrococcus sp. DT81.2 TaxID=3393414 RepID=UPI003CE5738D